MATDNIETFRISKFQAEVGMALAQKGGKLRSTITWKGGIERGKKAVVENLIGEVNPTAIEGRFADKQPTDAPMTRRWYTQQRYGATVWADSFDEVLTGIDVNGPLQQAVIEGMRREEDLRILKSAFASAITGEEGTSTETFSEDTAGDGQNTILASVGGSNTGLNSAKLKAIVEVFGRANVETEQPIYMAISEKDWGSLMAETALLSSDYVAKQALSDGVLPPLLGITFIKFSSVTLNKAGLFDGSNTYSLPVWIKSGLAAGSWADMSVDVQKLQRKWSTWEISAEATYGFTRLEPFKVLKVKTYY